MRIQRCQLLNAATVEIYFTYGAKKAFESGKSLGQRVIDSKTGNTYEISQFGKLTCYKLIEESMSQLMWRGFASTVATEYFCSGPIESE